MPISVDIPTLGKPKTVKDAVMSVLTNEWPLSSKQVYIKVRKMNLDVSYQAVHKALNEFVSKGILEKRGNRYKVEMNWIEKIKDFGNRLEKSYMSKRPIVKGDQSELIFENIEDMYLFFLEVLEKNKQPYKDACCFLDKYMWNMFFVRQHEIKRLEKVLERNSIYGVTKRKTHFDVIMKKFWETFGAKMELGKEDCVADHALVVIGDMIFHIYYPPDLTEYMERLYEKTESIMDVDLRSVNRDFYRKKTKIIILVNRNEEIAERTKNRTLKYFGEKWRK